MKLRVLTLVVLFAGVLQADNIAPKITEYNEYPSPENLAARELFQQRGFGLFVHYGLYSVSGLGEWQMFQDLIGAEKYYADRLPLFKPKAGCIDEWIRLAKDAGMNYIVLTTRHHEGYWLGDDFIREYADKVRAAGLGVGVYFSVADWSDAGYCAGPRKDPEGWKTFVAKAHKYLRHLMTDFGRIEYLFYDGCPPPQEWDLAAINGEMRRLQPHLLVCRCSADCDFKSCEGNTDFDGAPLWEACYTFNGSWGYNKLDFGFKPLPATAEMFFTMRHNGGNFLLNVGPMADGTVQSEAADRLRTLGKWVRSNREAIFDIVPHPFQYAPRELMTGGKTNRSNVYWMTMDKRIRDGRVINGIANRVRRMTYLDSGEEIPFEQDNSGKTPKLTVLKMRPLAADGMPYVVKIELEGEPKGTFNERLPTYAAADPVAAKYPKTSARAFKIRAVQLDLARQTETPDFIRRFAADAKASGFNTLVLYLEGRIRTKTFPYVPVEQSYSPEQMKDIVKSVTDLGLEVVPVVSVFGHAELFLQHDELADLSEERPNGGGSRWGWGTRNTFCHSQPATRKFLEAYLGEICEIFPGRFFHIGMDESFSTGFCEKCRPVFDDRTRGLRALYMDVVRWAHGYFAKRGRRIWMWDDFLEFFPEALDEFPKDVVLCHWNYNTDATRDGWRGHFYERGRRDWLKDYAARGMDAVVCPWVIKPENITAVTRHALSHEVAGGLLTYWEQQCRFHGDMHWAMRATGRLWCDPEKCLVEDPLKDAAPAVGLPDYAAPVDPDPLSEAALADERATWKRFLYLGFDRLPKLAELAVNPNRTDVETAMVTKGLEDILAEFRRLRPHRAEQLAKWRPGCWPNLSVVQVDNKMKEVEKALKVARTPVTDADWRLEMCYTLPNHFGVPRFTIYGRFGGEWREIAKGKSKPNYLPEFEGANFEHNYFFTAETAPDAVRIDYVGNGVEFVNFLALSKRGLRLVPDKVLSAKGQVLEPEKVLKDDWAGARFGYDDDAILDPAHSREHAVLEVLLKEDR